MEEVLREQYSGKSLDNLWPHERSEVQLEASRRLIHKEPERLLVIDGHLIVPSRRGWESGVMSRVWESIQLTAIIVVHVPPNELVSRSAQEVGVDPSHAAEQLKAAQTFVHATAAQFASALSGALPTSSGEADRSGGCALKEIVNSANHQAEAERELGDYIRASIR